MKKLLVCIVVILSVSSISFAQSGRKDSMKEKHIPQGSFYYSEQPKQTDTPLVKSVPPSIKEGPRYKTVRTGTPPVVMKQTLRKRPPEIMVDPKPTPKKIVEEQPITVKKPKRENPNPEPVYTQHIVRDEPTHKNRCKPCEEEERNRNSHYYN